MNVGFACLLECLANMAWSVVYAVSSPWKFGFVVCNVNSFLMEVVPVVYTWLLLSLAVDRVRRLLRGFSYLNSLGNVDCSWWPSRTRSGTRREAS